MTVSDVKKENPRIGKLLTKEEISKLEYGDVVYLISARGSTRPLLERGVFTYGARMVAKSPSVSTDGISVFSLGLTNGGYASLYNDYIHIDKENELFYEFPKENK